MNISEFDELEIVNEIILYVAWHGLFACGVRNSFVVIWFKCFLEIFVRFSVFEFIQCMCIRIVCVCAMQVHVWSSMASILFRIKNKFHYPSPWSKNAAKFFFNVFSLNAMRYRHQDKWFKRSNWSASFTSVQKMSLLYPRNDMRIKIQQIPRFTFLHKFHGLHRMIKLMNSMSKSVFNTLLIRWIDVGIQCIWLVSFFLYLLFINY